MRFGHPPTEQPQSEDAMNKILHGDSAWHESRIEAIAAGPPRPHPFEFDSWAEYLTADDEWRSGVNDQSLMADDS